MIDYFPYGIATALYINGFLWITAVDGTALLQYDFANKKLRTICTFEKEQKSFLFIEMLYVNEKIYLIPYNAEHLYEYDINENRLFSFKFESKGKKCITAIENNGKVILFPYYAGQSIKIFDIDTKTMYENNFAAPFKKKGEQIFSGSYIKTDEKVYMPLLNTRYLLQIDLHTGKIKKIAIKGIYENIDSIYSHANEIIIWLQNGGMCIGRQSEIGEIQIIKQCKKHQRGAWFKPFLIDDKAGNIEILSGKFMLHDLKTGETVCGELPFKNRDPFFNKLDVPKCWSVMQNDEKIYIFSPQYGDIIVIDPTGKRICANERIKIDSKYDLFRNNVFYENIFQENTIGLDFFLECVKRI